MTLNYERYVDEKRIFTLENINSKQLVSVRVETSGDGNCLPRAIAFWLLGNQKYHTMVRDRICKFGIQNRHLVKAFETEDIQYDERYFKELNKDGVWGDAIMIKMASYCFNQAISVYVNGNSHFYDPLYEFRKNDDIYWYKNFWILEFDPEKKHYSPLLFIEKGKEEQELAKRELRFIDEKSEDEEYVKKMELLYEELLYERMMRNQKKE